MKRVLVTILLLLSACASAPSRSGDADVRAAMSGFVEALNALNLDAMSRYFADDITAFVPLTKPERLDGKPAVVDLFRGYVDTTKKSIARMNIVPQDLRVDRFDDTAIVSFQVRNEQSVSRRTFVWHRDGDRWLIVHFHASNYRL